MGTRGDYEELAVEYDRFRNVHPGVVRELIEHAGIEARTRVVEVGSGTGNYLIAIHEATGCHAAGVEPSVAMIQQSRARASAIAWLEGRAEKLPLKNDAADFIFCVDVIHHVGNRLAFFQEAKRALSPGGRLCMATDSPSDILRRRPLSSHFPETIAVELGRYPSGTTLQAELTLAGFANLEETHVELDYFLTDITPYRHRAFSALRLIPEQSVTRGLQQLETELATGPVPAVSLYTLFWGSV